MKTATLKKDLVSVIIPAYNDQLTIGRCLASIAKQDYRNIEVIVIDDFSSDKTSSVVKELAQKKDLEIKIILNKKHKERNISRNLGAKIGQGKYFLFIDSDMQLSKRIISDCIRLISNDHVIKAIIIPEESVGDGFWAECRHLEKKCYLGDDDIEAARFFEKEALWNVGGWDNRMISGEDWDLTRRIRARYKVDRIKSFIYHNEGNLTLIRIMKKKFYYASVSGIYLEKNPLSILSLMFFVFRPAYLRNWRLIISDPIHGAGMFFLKTTELFAGVAGYLFSKLPNLL